MMVQQEQMAALAQQGFGEREHSILEFEKLDWKYTGAKEAAIRARFELSVTHYYQLLNALIGTEEAMRAYPILVARLRNRRSTRSKQLADGYYGVASSVSVS